MMLNIELKVFYVWFFSFLLSCFPCASSTIHDVSVEKRNLTEIAEFINHGWNDIWKDLQSNNQSMLQKALEGGVNLSCLQQLQNVLKGLEHGELWALKMIDASAKIPSGILSGNLFQAGHYDECTGIEKQYQSLDETKVLKGQYCVSTVMIGSKTPLKMHFGICTPSSCTADDFNFMGQIISKELSPKVQFLFSSKTCSTVDSKTEIPTRTVLALIFFALYGTLLIFATVIDISTEKGYELIKCFSFLTNGKKLFFFKSKSNEDSIDSLNGIRAISMMMVLLGHVSVTKMRFPALNPASIEEYENQLFSYFFVGLGFFVDSFFTISGLLVVYLFLKTTRKGGSIRWKMYYIHRLLRLMPSVVVMVIIYATLLQLFEPKIYSMVDSTYGAICRKHWWSTILHIQNYVHPADGDTCAVHTWYLAIDMQLYFLAPPLLILLTKKPRAALGLLLVLTLASITLSFEETIRKSLGATLLNEKPEEYVSLYTPTHIRMVPWLIGAATGYFIAENKYKTPFSNKVLVICLWLISFSIITFILLIEKIYHDTEYNALTSACFNAFSRPLWAVGISLMIWLCVSGNGGYINSFLSCRLFNFLIRLNFSIYMIHLLILSIIIGGTLDSPQFLSYFVLIHESLADYCIVVFFAILWTLSFESPIIALEKIIFPKDKNKNRGTTGNSNSKENC